MPKNLGHIESLARSYTDTAIKTLAGIMMEQTSPPMARIAAAKVLLVWLAPAAITSACAAHPSAAALAAASPPHPQTPRNLPQLRYPIPRRRCPHYHNAPRPYQLA